ncbi:hypothetical protein JXM67_08825, partial [candidate division WOR-3 bacterium]|nr:hypothetical protein [candidate division WOR-3 bacterium]
MKFNKLVSLSAAVLVFVAGSISLAQEVEVESPEGVASGEITQGSLRIIEEGKTLELPLEHTDVE